MPQRRYSQHLYKACALLRALRVTSFILWLSPIQSITGSISIWDVGDHGLPLIAILCLSNRSSIVNSHPVSDVAEPSVPWSSSSLLAVNCTLEQKALVFISSSPYNMPKIPAHSFLNIIFMSCGLTFKPTKMSFLLTCCWNDIFNILL